MDKNIKKALIVFGGGFLLFLAFKKLRPFGGKSKKTKSPTSTNTNQEQLKNAAIISKAYSDAVKAGENKAFLDEMNAEFTRSYQMRVVPSKANGGFIAVDLQGNKVS